MSELSLPEGSTTSARRNVAIAAGVVAFHVLALWALQAGLLRRAVEVVVPVEMLSEIITPPSPRPELPKPVVKPPEPIPQRVAPRKIESPPPAPKLTAAPDLPPTPGAPTAAVEPQPAPPPVTAPVAVAPAPVAPAAPAKIELPSSSADYLQNPKPAYPPTSRRLGEQGKVVVRVLIGADGTAKDAQVKVSSGYDRLDRAALEAVLKWRYVPGKRGGIPEPMWFDAPINFSLEQP